MDSQIGSPRTPMSERQQLALIRCMESKRADSPPRTPLRSLQNRGEEEAKTPKTPAEEKLRRKLCKKNAKGETPLHAAAIKGRSTLVRRLLALGASPNVKDNAGWSPLHEAANRGNLKVARVLIRYGADVNSLGDGKETPLHDAARNGHIQVVQYLIKSGAYLGARNISANTPLDVAAHPENRCRNPQLQETIEYLNSIGTSEAVDSKDLESSFSDSSSDTSSCEDPDEEAIKFLGLEYTKREMKKALVSKSANLTSCSDKFVNPSSRVTVRLQPPLEPSNPSIKTRLTYGMEDTHAQSTSSTTTAAPKEDIYEFKSSSKEATPVRSSQSPEPKHEAENKVTEDKPDKRPLDEGLEEDPKRKKQKKDELSKGRGSRGSSMEKGPICPKTAKTRVSNNEQQSQAMSGSPKKPESDSDDDNSKKSTDSSGLKVPPLKIVLSAGNNSGNATPPSSGVENNSRNETPTISNSINQNPSTSGIENNSKKLSASLGRYVNKEDNNSFSNNEEGRSEEANDGDSGGTNEKGGRMTRSKAHQGTPGPDGFGDSQGASSSSDQTATDSSDNRDHKNPSSDYSFKKRKLRSQVEDNVNSNSSSIFTRGGNGGNNGSSNGNGCSNLNGNNSNGGNPNGNLGCGGNGNNSAIEPMNDIEKYLHIRKQIEQRRKNLFPVQPKPPQGFKDYLMNRKSYLLQENASERLRQIPLIQPPPSLEGAMVELFKEQEEARRKLRMKHVVEKEKLVLSVEQEILRVHGRAARALANQSLPYSLCTILRDEEIYTPIDPQQEEKNRDIRSRYNGRLFLSWLQDVDDKWERIKEQMVLRHHNEAESLNAVQKMDWEWKLKEISDNPSSFNDSIKPQIDDLLIPMVHVSDEFDLTDCRN